MVEYGQGLVTTVSPGRVQNMKKKILAGFGVLVVVLIAVLFALSNLNNNGSLLLTSDNNESDTSSEPGEVSSESLYTDNSQEESEDL